MKGLAGKLLLAAWAVVTLVAISSLAVSHTAAMPEPARGGRLAGAALALRQDASRPFLVHVISARCSCTERLFAHLMERGAFPGTGEVVLFVGEDAAKQAAAARAGFRFLALSAEDLARRFELEAAPVLLAFDASGRMRYAGGYFSHPSTIFPQDASIHAELAQGATPRPLPVYGCAVSANLQKKVDPLGIVY
jgi:hypothetical protein